MTDHFKQVSRELLAPRSVRPVCSSRAIAPTTTARLPTTRTWRICWSRFARTRCRSISCWATTITASAFGKRCRRRRLRNARSRPAGGAHPHLARKLVRARLARKELSTPGLLGQEQLDWLAGALDANRRKPALILVHHNPGTMASVSGLKTPRRFNAVIRPRKQVKAYIFGHTHVWQVTQDPSGIHLINLRRWPTCSRRRPGRLGSSHARTQGHAPGVTLPGYRPQGPRAGHRSSLARLAADARHWLFGGRDGRRTFGDYLYVQGIENQLELHKPEGWAVWVKDEDKIEPATSC